MGSLSLIHVKNAPDIPGSAQWLLQDNPVHEYHSNYLPSCSSDSVRVVRSQTEAGPQYWIGPG